MEATFATGTGTQEQTGPDLATGSSRRRTDQKLPSHVPSVNNSISASSGTTTATTATIPTAANSVASDIPSIVQNMRGFQGSWVGEDQVFVGFSEIGQQAVLHFEIPQKTEGSLILGWTTGPDFGEFAILLDGKTIAQGVNAFSPQVSRAEVALKVGFLELGIHNLTLAVSGKSSSPAGFRLGLDTVTFLTRK